jgi:hypothetical protein
MLYEHEEYICQYLDTYMATKDGMHVLQRTEKQLLWEN